jgi:hypothetical protein
MNIKEFAAITAAACIGAGLHFMPARVADTQSRRPKTAGGGVEICFMGSLHALDGFEIKGNTITFSVPRGGL